MISALAFWSALALLVYAHAGYPLLLALWVRSRARRKASPPPQMVATEQLPGLTVVVVAHGEESRIEARLENLLGQDYPREKLSILLGSDGSRDATAARARGCALRLGAAERVEVFDFPQQRGKPSVLNELVPRARGELVVLADARQRFEPDALRVLASRFQGGPGSEKIGAVSGELMLEPAAGEAGEGTGLYWRYEKFLRKSESAIDSTIGATGAIYAIRRALFAPLPADTVLDDMLIPVRILRRGYRVLFEPGARAWDRAASAERELERKARTLSGNFQLFARERWLLNPFANRAWLQTVSHKVLRLCVPPLLALLFVASALLALRSPRQGGALLGGPRLFYALALAGQLAFYAAALWGRGQARRGRGGVRTAPYLFCLLHWATVLGFVRFLRGQATAAWKQAPEAAQPKRTTEWTQPPAQAWTPGQVGESMNSPSGRREITASRSNA